MQICHDEDTLWEQSFWLPVFITLFLIILFKCCDYEIPSNLWEDVYIAECTFFKETNILLLFLFFFIST